MITTMTAIFGLRMESGMDKISVSFCVSPVCSTSSNEANCDGNEWWAGTRDTGGDWYTGT